MHLLDLEVPVDIVSLTVASLQIHQFCIKQILFEYSIIIYCHLDNNVSCDLIMLLAVRVRYCMNCLILTYIYSG